MKRTFTLLIAAIAIIVAMVTPQTVWGQTEVVYKTALFGRQYNSQSVNNYTTSWYATNDGFRVNLDNFNNNTNQWDYVKCGSKNNASIGIITTNDVIDEAITKVALKIDAITSSSVNSITLYSGASASTITTEVGSFEKSSGVQIVTIDTPTNNLFYKIVCDCKKGSSNGLVTISKIEYYKESGASSTTVDSPIISPSTCNFVGSQEVSITCATEGATILYTTNDWSTSTTYTSPFTITETTTVKAKATKAGMNDSYEASETFTKITPLATIQEFLNAATSTTTKHFVTFTNFVVSAVSGSNAYVTDGSKGFIIFKSEHGFNVGDILNGTFEASLKLYKGAAEFTDITANTTGLTVTTGGTVTPLEIAFSDLSGVHTGVLVSFSHLQFDGTYLLNEEGNQLKPYNQLFSDMSFTNGGTYNVTGIFFHNDGNPKEIMPRSADDIFLVQKVITPVFSLATGTYAGTQNVEITSGTDGCTIYYTTDGTEPTTASNVYSSPITVSQDMTIKAFATKANYTDSDVVTASYTIKPAFSITYGTFTNGTVSGLTTAYEGQQVQLTVTPSSGYALENLTVSKADDPTTIVPTTGNTFTMPAYNVMVNATFDLNFEVTYDFTQIPGFSSWNSSYNQRIVEYDDATVTFDAAARQTTTIMNQPVTKGSPVSLVMKDNTTITAVTFRCTQWSSKTQTITLHYSTNGGSTYTSTGITSSNFIITCNELPSGTNAVKITFSESSNQIGIASATILKESQQYGITIAEVENGTIEASKTAASQGQTVTLTAHPDEGYALLVWNVYKTGDASTSVLVTDDHFTMPNYGVTVSATFAAASAITYSVNGVASTEYYLPGIAINLPTPTENIPVGFAFSGWTLYENVTPLVTLESPYTVEEDATLTAVFTKLSSITILRDPVSSTSYPDGEQEYNFEGYTFGADQILGNSNYIQLKAEEGYLYNKTPFAPRIMSIVTHQSGSIHRDATLLAGTTQNPTEGVVITPTNDDMVDTYDFSDGSYSYIRIENNTLNAVRYISVTINFGDENGSYTRVFQDVDAEITTAEVLKGIVLIDYNASITIKEGGSWTIDGELTNTNPAHLVVEDGGQLFHTNDGVAATIKRDITGYGEGEERFYLISEPNVYGIDIEYSEEYGGTNLTTGDYDLYNYDEPTAYWHNHKELNGSDEPQFQALGRSWGYLYANKEDITISMVVVPVNGYGLCHSGNMYYFYPVSNESTILPGFNLIGNPLPCNAYVYYLDGEDLLPFNTFYKMNEDGTELEEVSGDTPLSPLEGAFIQYNGSQVLYFSIEKPILSSSKK